MTDREKQSTLNRNGQSSYKHFTIQALNKQKQTTLLLNNEQLSVYL